MVSFTPLDIGDEESIETALFQVDSAIQVGLARGWGLKCGLGGRVEKAEGGYAGNAKGGKGPRGPSERVFATPLV